MGGSVDQILQSIPSPIVLIIGVGVLLLGGHWLVEGSVRISRRLGVSSLVIGMTVVAFGTSAPELAFNLIAAWSRHTELSFGNVVGSNIANITLVIGAAALAGPLVVSSRVIRLELPLLILVSLGVLGLALRLVPLEPDGPLQPGFDRLDGIILLAALAAFTAVWYVAGRHAQLDPLIAEASAEQVDEAQESARPNLFVAALLVVVGLGFLLSGGKMAQIGAVGIAEWLGLPEVVVGLTIVALSTSLPEVAASVIAVRRGHSDLAIGNVVGSNLLNTLLVLGSTCLVAPVPAPAPYGIWDLVVMNVLTLLLLRIALSRRDRVSRTEGIVLLVCYSAYVAWTVVR